MILLSYAVGGCGRYEPVEAEDCPQEIGWEEDTQIDVLQAPLAKELVNEVEFEDSYAPEECGGQHRPQFVRYGAVMAIEGKQEVVTYLLPQLVMVRIRIRRTTRPMTPI